MTRKRVPATLRNAVWNKYVGNDIGKTLCHVKCGEYITRGNFECGHVVSVKEGGPMKLYNLRPICSTCNKSMGTDNMAEFMNTLGLGKLSNGIYFKGSRRELKKKLYSGYFDDDTAVRIIKKLQL